ncbi:hypothetical protein B484DRAFT_460254, partial [Ochromonadaceae sp. CCMP2298]
MRSSLINRASRTLFWSASSCRSNLSRLIRYCLFSSADRSRRLLASQFEGSCLSSSGLTMPILNSLGRIGWDFMRKGEVGGERVANSLSISPPPSPSPLWLLPFSLREGSSSPSSFLSSSPSPSPERPALSPPSPNPPLSAIAPPSPPSSPPVSASPSAWGIESASAPAPEPSSSAEVSAIFPKEGGEVEADAPAEAEAEAGREAGVGEGAGEEAVSNAKETDLRSRGGLIGRAVSVSDVSALTAAVSPASSSAFISAALSAVSVVA